MPILNDHVVKNFDKGTITRTESRVLPKGAARDSLNWLTEGDQISLRRGTTLIGDEQSGSGKITGLFVGTRFDGTQVIWRTRGRKLETYNTTTELWQEDNTANLLPVAASGEDVCFTPAHGISGAMTWLSSKNSSIYKIPMANPRDAVDQLSTAHRGKIKVLNGGLYLWDRKDTNGGRDQTGLYRSYLDKDELSDFTAVSNEALGSSGSLTYSGTLAFKAGGVKRTCMYVSIDDTSETFRDDRNGVLVGSAGGTGTINYSTGAYSVTFFVAAVGAVTADYYWEDSSSAGMVDFSKSAPRTAGQGFVLRQDDGGADMQNIGVIGSHYFCYHTFKTWDLTISADDSTEVFNKIYRARVGIPYWRALAETGEGTWYVDNSDQNDPYLRLLTYSPRGNDQIIPISASDNIDFSDYRFDVAVVRAWGNYILLACRHKDSTFNNTMFVYDKFYKTWDRMDYRATTLDEYDGTLIAGDSISNNVSTLFADWTDEESNIPNYWESGDDNLGVDGVKVTNKMVVAGLIQPDQELEVSISVDGGAFTLVKTIEGDADYVDQGNQVTIGSSVMGSHEIGGGGDGETASPFRVEFNINSDRYEFITVRFEATKIGYCAISEYILRDNRYRGRSVTARYRDN